ncbi:hypothetical protein I305_00953 [Cryptococcus gattii E566]|uniref:Uncharacterized protein n=1 Tax=Cryptococcus gattii serotype B (strain WM276 / ATCC MYA-4071) TaxID=367775 RepID=E6R3F1_CRYGW|nr:Hypothetical Protein CGB_C4330W [Cryptococcus gattii WM276]ADV21012.1 Hypothetical Protein CGB_C4330W [Cryptococcus gattii WM276]KIY36904.1 hypothetical protein I305_00953 [Cryptococcus gattii E566]
MPAIPSKQAPAETPNVVIPEATPSSEEAKEMLKTEKPVSETTAPNITEPVVEEQPIIADTEAGTGHSGPELAKNKADNTEADKHVEGTKTEEGAKTTEEVHKVAKAKEDKKDVKKSAVKEKTEKTKAEGKGFFAKFFGNKDKSPKKEKKKTPKAEKTDPVIAAAPIETKDGGNAVPQSASTATEPAIYTAPATEAVEPAVESPEAGAPIVIDSATAPADAPAEAAPIPEENKIAEKKDEVKDHAGKPNLKAHRRLSARIGDIFKPKKKEDISSPKEEISKEEATAPLNEEAPAVASEAPKLGEPVATEPLNLEEEPKTAPPPAAAPVAASA